MRSAFTSGLTNIQATISGAATWFFESGKKVVSTFADGIRSAFTGAVDAVKGGLQRIRNEYCYHLASVGPYGPKTTLIYAELAPGTIKYEYERVVV